MTTPTDDNADRDALAKEIAFSITAMECEYQHPAYQDAASRILAAGFSRRSAPVVTDGLLPCPFCGSTAEKHGQYRISCAGPCGMMMVTTGHYTSEADCIEAWNRRAIPPPPSHRSGEGTT
ncbi:MAG: Lar family restriction alleviation protein [Pseudomonadota bacterium]